MSNDKIENNNKLYIRYSGGISQFSYQSLIKNLQHHINSARFNELYLCISPSCLIYIGIEIYNYLKSLKDIKIITHFLTYNNKTTANKKIICELAIKQLLSSDYQKYYISVLQSSLGYSYHSIKEFVDKECKTLPNFNELISAYKTHCKKHVCKASVLYYHNNIDVERDFLKYGLMKDLKSIVEEQK